MGILLASDIFLFPGWVKFEYVWNLKLVVCVICQNIMMNWAQICAYVNKLTLEKSATLVTCWAFFLAGCTSLLLPLWSFQTTRGFCYLQRACFCTLLGFMLIATHLLLAAFRYIFNRQRMIMIFSSRAKQQNVKLPPPVGWRSEMLCEVCAVDVRCNPIGGKTMQCFRVSVNLSH